MKEELENITNLLMADAKSAKLALVILQEQYI